MNPFNVKKFVDKCEIPRDVIKLKTTKEYYEMFIKDNWYYCMEWFPKKCCFDDLDDGIRFWVERKKQGRIRGEVIERM